MRFGFDKGRYGVLLFCAIVGLALPAKLHAVSHSEAPGQFYAALDESDRPLAFSSLQQTLETYVSNRVGTWRNRSSGNSGSIVPLRTYRIETGYYCRDYRETVIARQRTISRLGTACRDQHGEWISVERK